MAKKLKPYAPTSYLDFNNPSVRRQQQEALAKVRKKFAKEYPIIVGGRKIKTGDTIDSLNPACIAEVVGHFHLASREHAESAIQAAQKAFESWSRVPAEERAEYLFRAAERMRERRLEINAWMISEVGKNYAEADADTAEAIDFLEYYGREMLRYASPEQPLQYPGEVNQLVYLPLGVGAVIPPWNFPFAITAGMTTAAIVTGNTVVLKPSSDSPMMAWLLVEILTEVGVPKGVVNFVPGHGGEIGDFMVDHPQVRFISFTGSAAVGKRINERAARTPENQLWLKRVVAEMGGKDAIIVDSDADVDMAVEGVAVSAFGFQGQKCSACSRAIVDAKVYDEFVAKLQERVARIQIGDPKENVYMGPVSSERAYKGILNYIEVGKKEGRLLNGGGPADGPGWFIQPTVFVDVPAGARIEQEEIFGPVLAVVKAKNFDHALQIANNSPYGLTGAVYSENAEKLERASREFFVGNLYLNRKCTGALVGVHPFGGFNLSGTDSKAGGRDYLLLFLQAKSVATKIGGARGAARGIGSGSKKAPAAKRLPAKKGSAAAKAGSKKAAGRAK
ncbi:MAG: L-glutamate gamma-semialdehyde dehydrogenase [Bacteroidetes bacterium]|nr:L-glutamate gamma-semialdehyde dehydrogenase [Bacteroidota bacterium]